MPEVVSIFNGMGGLAAALISMIEWTHLKHVGEAIELGLYVPIIAGLIIGTISFTGSMVAWGKLNGKLGDFRFPAQQYINAIILVFIIAAAFFMYS